LIASASSFDFLKGESAALLKSMFPEMYLSDPYTQT
jgi:hypothetical protein